MYMRTSLVNGLGISGGAGGRLERGLPPGAAGGGGTGMPGVRPPARPPAAAPFRRSGSGRAGRGGTALRGRREPELIFLMFGRSPGRCTWWGCAEGWASSSGQRIEGSGKDNRGSETGLAKFSSQLSAAAASFSHRCCLLAFCSAPPPLR